MDSNKKQYKLNLGKPNEGSKNKDFASISGNFRNSPISNVRKSPKIMIINDDSICKNENSSEVKVNDDKTKSDLDLSKNRSVSQFYN